MITFHAGPKEPLNNEEIQTLFENLNLILKNAEKILEDEKYRDIHVKGTGIDGIYIGHIDLVLGDLIRLWQNGKWRNGQKFYYHLGGSPLSGMSFCTYWENGNIGCDRNKPSFCTLLRPAETIIKKLDKEDESGAIKLPFPARRNSEMKIGELIENLIK